MEYTGVALWISIGWNRGTACDPIGWLLYCDEEEAVVVLYLCEGVAIVSVGVNENLELELELACSDWESDRRLAGV